MVGQCSLTLQLFQPFSYHKGESYEDSPFPTFFLAGKSRYFPHKLRCMLVVISRELMETLYFSESCDTLRS